MYQKFSTPLPNTQKFHHIQMEENNDDNDDDDDEYQESIKPIIGQFYHVKYNFFDAKGNVTAKVLPATCSQNDLEEHLFTFMKTVRRNKYTLDTNC